jgi:MFS family permease
MGTSEIFGEFIHKPSLIYTFFGIASVVFVTTSMITWLPKYLQETQMLTEKAAGLKASLVMVLAIIGAPLGGYLSDVWRQRKIKARLLFPTVSTIISAVLLFIAFNFLSGFSQYVCFLFFGISVMAFISAAAAVTQDVVHPGLRAISYSIAVVVQNLLGASTAPIIIGSIIDDYNIKTAMSILPFMLVIGAILFFLASLHYEKDLKKVDVIPLEVAP